MLQKLNHFLRQSLSFKKSQLPAKKRTKSYRVLVSSLTVAEIQLRLLHYTKPTDEKRRADDAERYLFLGNIHFSYFELIRTVWQPHSFLVIAQGHVESTSTGTLIWLRYRVFKSTFWVVGLGLLLGIVMGLWFLWENIWWNAFISFLLAFLHLFFSIENIRRQRKLIYERIVEVLQT
ncbi:hypothetical protein [Hugenholtzia roseola]|uniref:hypothetical protein n=1 Tax=Hugenholtzia roseola TaxID=1002 RepID=UPI0003FD0A1D|nr:hypothetical protein [Hugenholtzia roseola]